MKRTLEARNARRGYALVTSLATITLFMIVGTSMLGLASTNVRTAIRRQEAAQALNLAMGALDHATAALEADPTYTGFTDRALGPGRVSVSVTTPPGQPMRRIVVASGTVVGSNHSVTRRVRAVMDTGPLPPVYYLAIGAKRSFELQGTVLVASSPTPNRGDVHCNEDIILNGNTTVQGNVTATGRVYITGQPLITGATTSGVDPMAFPEVTTDFKQQAVADGVRIGNVSVSDGSLVKGKIVGDLTIGSPSGCRVEGVVWVTGSLTISGPVTGQGTIVADGSIDLDARATYLPTDVSRVAIVTTSSSSSAVTLRGNREFKGLLYAPSGGVQITGTPSLLGNILAQSITFAGTPTINRWTGWDDSPPPLPRPLQVRGWQEL